MILRAGVESFLSAQRGEVVDSTLQWYSCHLRSLVEALGEVGVQEISPDDVRSWRASLLDRDQRWNEHPLKPAAEGGLSPRTVNGALRAAKRFFNWLVEEGYLEYSPASRLRSVKTPNRPPKFVRKADLLAMMKVAKEDKRDYALLLVLADTGIRVEGLTGLSVQDVDLEAGELLVTEKGGKSHYVHLNPGPLEALGDWLEVRPQEGSDKVFISRCSRCRKGLTKSGVYQVLKRLAEAAGVEGPWNPHAFRHGLAHALLSNGADLTTVRDLLHHSSIQVTADSYSQWTGKELSERHAEFSWLGENGLE